MTAHSRSARGFAGALAVYAALWTSVLAGSAQQQPTFRSTASSIVVPVSVTDKNAPVARLTAADFQVFDNDVAQDAMLATVDRLPIDVAILMDTSGSLDGRALDQIKVDVQQMSDLLQPNDRVRVVTFGRASTDVFGLQPGGARVPVDRIEAGGATSVYDALATALVAFPYVDRPQVIFAVTDGRDNSSFLDADRIVALAEHSSSLLFVALVSPTAGARTDGKIEAFDPRAEQSTVMIQTPASTGAGLFGNLLVPNSGSTTTVSRYMGLFYGGPNKPALSAAAAATGGAVFDDPSGATIPQRFRHVLDDFRASYLLSYTPRGVVPAGWHAITVKVKNPRYTVRTRKGYDGGS
jgi:VWFA-related protein